MIVMFTDFGVAGPYAGQMKAALAAVAPAVSAIDLMHDAPVFRPKASAYLLAALVRPLPAGTVVLGVVDPGVGSPGRRPVAARAGGRWFVGPDNGLFAIAAQHAGGGEWWEIDWRPERLSNTFHGRDLFAPVAARLALGEEPPAPRHPAELSRIYLSNLSTPSRWSRPAPVRVIEGSARTMTPEPVARPARAARAPASTRRRDDARPRRTPPRRSECSRPRRESPIRRLSRNPASERRRRS